ncbi:MAG: DUF2800 domain-containing protein [Propionibacteriaceae bacterium]|nr:DUF2800 domain-containing protein [Propionibacteriaceae bacterium]
MSERAHAVLSASSSSRWLACPPSALLNADTPDSCGDAAEQGTAAHALAEHKLRRALKRRSHKPASPWIDDEMEEHTDSYVTWVVERIAELGRPLVLVEERLDYSRWAPDGFGTGDCVLISDGVLHVIDLKYGQGVLVACEGNTQMMLYALGAWDTFGLLYEIDEVRMTIYQPRRDNVSTWTMPLTELLAWADSTLAPAAQLAAEGEGEYASGDWCRFCAIRNTCRARAEANLALARLEFKPAAELSDEEISEVLAKLPGLTSWANDVQAHALEAATNHGKRWPGFKLVAGRSSRRWSNEAAVEAAATKAGFHDIHDTKLIGIPAMEKLMGKTTFHELLGDLVDKPPGKPALVPSTDKRPELVVESAENEFTPINQ